MKIGKIAALLLALCLLLSGMAAAEAPEEAPRRVVYLTFDDGPKEDTAETVALLEALDVPATFFFVGSKVGKRPEQAALVCERGYAVGCHSMDHSFERLNDEGAEDDMEAFCAAMTAATGKPFSTKLFRFPGGSTRYDRRIRRDMARAGYVWIDWSAETGDARVNFESDSQMLQYTRRELGHQDVVVLLMHEGKSRTRRVLKTLVAEFREKGYEFRALTTSAEDREILKNCKINMLWPEDL